MTERKTDLEQFLAAAEPSRARKTPGEAAVAAALAAFDAAVPDHDSPATEEFSEPTQESIPARRLPSERRDPRRNGRRIMKRIFASFTPRRVALVSSIAVIAAMGYVGVQGVMQPMLFPADPVAMSPPGQMGNDAGIGPLAMAEPRGEAYPEGSTVQSRPRDQANVTLNPRVSDPNLAAKIRADEDQRAKAALENGATFVPTPLKDPSPAPLAASPPQISTEADESVSAVPAGADGEAFVPAPVSPSSNLPASRPSATPQPQIGGIEIPEFIYRPGKQMSNDTQTQTKGETDNMDRETRALAKTIMDTAKADLQIRSAPVVPVPTPPQIIESPTNPARTSPKSKPSSLPMPNAPSIPRSPPASQQGAWSQAIGLPEPEWSKRLNNQPIPTITSPAADTTITTPTPQGQSPDFRDAPFKRVADEPVATFSSDVDSASYQLAKKVILQQNTLPAPTGVRVEEFVNAFQYAYPAPAQESEGFRPTVTVHPAPWNRAHQVVQIGIKGYEVPADQRPAANLVFLVDTSGSMSSTDKLPLVQQSLRLLVDQLKPEDRVAIVTYAGSAGVLLNPTQVSDKETIIAAINGLTSGGSTNGAGGLMVAYELAKQNLNRDAINRVFLATDGDFNVGVVNSNSLGDYVEQEKNSGVFLTVLGYGTGNYNDTMMQDLAQRGNGVAAYIGDRDDARRVLVDGLTANMLTIAKDVKFQIEFNPGQVREYRQIGYETRKLNTQNFDNDKFDAGDVGAGHSVTALFEVVPVNAPESTAAAPDLRYQPKPAAPVRPPVSPASSSQEIAFLKIRFKPKGQEESKLITRPITQADVRSLTELGADQRFALSVAGFAQWLRRSPDMQRWSLADIRALADGARGEDKSGARDEFIGMIRAAEGLMQQQGWFPAGSMPRPRSIVD